MSTSDFNLNRAIHLARRDVQFERAVELLATPLHDLATEPCIAHVTESLDRLNKAHQHAIIAAQSTHTASRENDFQRFLELVIHNVASAQAMLQHRQQLEHDQGFLCRFLSATQEECALPALHYQRRADDILQGVWHLLRLAVPAYHRLKAETATTLPETEQKRYEKAYTSFQAEVVAQATT